MMEQEFKYLQEYMDIVIQLLTHKVSKVDLPEFEYYKKTRGDKRYSLAMPNYVDTVYITDGLDRVYSNHCKGVVMKDRSLFYREYNYWKGFKYYTGGNILGNYKLNLDFK